MKGKIIDGIVYWADLHKLMQSHNDWVCVNGTWQLAPMCSNIYIYKQILVHEEWIPYYVACKSDEYVTQIIKSESNLQNRYFGEVVLQGNFYYILSKLHASTIEYIKIAQILLKCTNATNYDYFTHHDSEHTYVIHYLYRKTETKNIQLFWEAEDMVTLSKIVNTELNMETNISINLNIYNPRQHMTFPNCTSPFPPHKCYKSLNPGCIEQIKKHGQTERGAITIVAPFYKEHLSVLSTKQFNQILIKYGITMENQINIDEYTVTCDNCVSSNIRNCQAIIKITPDDILYFCSHNNSYVRLNNTNMVVVDISSPRPEKIVDDYFNINHTFTEYAQSVKLLKQMVAIDKYTNMIILRRRDINGNVYWSTENRNKIPERKVKVRNAEEKMVYFYELLESMTPQLLNDVVWMPFSWLYRPKEMDDLKRMNPMHINTYFTTSVTKPKDDFSCPNFKRQMLELFCGNRWIANLFILFMAMVVQKPFHKSKLHIILQNANSGLIQKLFTSILNNKIVQIQSALTLNLNVPQCVVCIVQNYEKISSYKTSASTKFYMTRVFGQNNTGYISNTFNFCHTISIHMGNTMPTQQLSFSSINEVILNTNPTIVDIDTTDVYDYLMSIDCEEYEQALLKLNQPLMCKSQFTKLPIEHTPDPVVDYFIEITNFNRPNIKPGTTYNTTEVYEDYKHYLELKNIAPQTRKKFGMIAETIGITPKRVREGNQRPYKYTIPHIINKNMV